MKTVMTVWGEGTAVATRGVLAGAYRARSEERATVTHAVLVDGEGFELGEKTVCGRVSVESLADCYSTDELAKPTCSGCCKKLAR